MKKLIALLLIIAGTFNVDAHTVSVETAKSVGANFYKQNVAHVIPSLQLAYTETSLSGEAVYYVFNVNNNDGFVIISAEDATEPILGYSNTGQYIIPQKSTNVEFWLQGRKNEIISIRNSGTPATKDITDRWNAYLNNTTSGSVRSPMHPAQSSQFPSNTNYLVKSLWNQSPYYNSICPGGSVTGCVACAMAQIIKYWQYPAIGKGGHCYNDDQSSGFQEDYGSLCAQFDTTHYNWTEMPISLTASSPSNQIAAVSTLMYDAGVSVDMDYSPSESGAWVITGDDDSVCAQIAYYKYFKYDSATIQGFYASKFTAANWQSLVENELNNSRPVEYVGWDPSAGGHTWVCDGYNSTGQFHMNWGWGGQDNGWFALNDLNPGGAGGYNFSEEIEAVIGIQPPNTSPCNLVASFNYSIGSGGNVTFTSNSTGVSNGAVYSWYPGDGSPATNGSSTFSYTYKYNGTYYVYLNIQNTAAGCNSWAFDSVVITNATPCNLIANFSYTIGNNGQVTFTSTSTGVNSGATYDWQPGDGSNSTNAGNTFTYTYQYNGYYYVTLNIQNSGYGCAAQVIIPIEVYNAPPCNLTAGYNYAEGSGGNVTFTSTSTGVNPGAAYYWYPGDGSPEVAGGTTFNYTYLYNGTYSPTLEVFDSGYNGCYSEYYGEVGITNANTCNLLAKFNYTEGSNGQVTFKSTSTGIYGATYYWDPGDGNPETIGGSTYNHTYLYNGTYYVILDIQDSGYGCYSNMDSEITITNARTCDLNASFNAVNGSNGQVTFTSTSTGVYGATYYWNPGDGNPETTGSSTYSHTYLYNGTYYVELEIQDSGYTCSDVTDSEITITNARPCDLNVSFNAVNGSNGQVTFTSTSTGVYSGATYYWNPGDGNPETIGSSTYSHTYLYNGTYYVELEIQDSGYGCYNTLDSEITITNARPCDLNVSFNAVDGSNGQVNFISTSTGVYSGATYYWDPGDGNPETTGGSTYNHTYLYNGTYFVQLYIQDSGYGCSSNIDSEITITNARPCDLNISFNTANGSNGLVTFTSTSTGVYSGATYYWDPGDGDPETIGGSTYSHTYLYNGTYFVQLNIQDSGYGCENTLDSEITITNAQICDLNASFDYSVNSGLRVTFTSTSTGVLPAASYYWYTSDGYRESGSSTYTHTFLNTGNYYAQLEIENPGYDCYAYYGDSIKVYNKIVNVPANNGLSIYPNPNEGQFTVYMQGITSGNAEINIYNVLGQTVFSMSAPINNYTLSMPLSLIGFSKGMYFISVITSTQIFTGKVYLGN